MRPLLLFVRGLFIASLAVLLTSIIELATNFLAADPPPEWLFEFIQKNPLWAILGAGVGIALLGAIERSLTRRARGPSAQRETSSTSQVLLNQPKFYNPVTFTQNISPEAPYVEGEGSATTDTEESTTPYWLSTGTTSSQAAVLYSMSPFLPEQWKWENVVHDAAESAGVLSVLLNQENLSYHAVCAVVVVLSAAQYNAVKDLALNDLLLAKSQRPTVRLLIFAVGWSDQSVDEGELHALANAAGLTANEVRAAVCSRLDDFRECLKENIQLALRTDTKQKLLAGDGRQAAEQEMES